MSYNFTKFESRNLRQEDRITVTKSHSIGFPTKFYHDNKINEFKYVALYWDNEQKALGLKFTNDSTGNEFSIIHSKSGYGGSIVARSFFKFNNLDPSRFRGRYLPKKVDVPELGQLFVIELVEKQENEK
jgi:hypothetical protein